MKKKGIYRVEWLDITNFTNRKIEKPYKQYLTNAWTIGEILEDKDTVLVVNSGGDDNQVCGDAIPKNCVTKITKI